MKMRMRTVGALFLLAVILVCVLGGCGMGDTAGEGSAQESMAAQAEESEETGTSEEAETEMAEETGTSDTQAEEDPAAVPGTETQEETDSQDQEDRMQVPDFSMTLLDGTKVRFSDYEGKKILLNFWATWCGPCVGEMPAFQRLAEEYPDELTILAVNCAETQSEVQRFIEKNGYTFPVVLDEDGAIAYLFGGIDSIPVTVVIDEEGCLVTASTGASDADTMYAEYKEMLGF